MEKQVPFNIEAEQGVLGSILIDPEAIGEVDEFLKPAYFYREAHRILFETIRALYNQRIPADFITLCDTLERDDRLGTVGGPGEITKLINGVPTSGNVVYYGRIVERLAKFRFALAACGDIAAAAYAQDEQVFSMAEQRFFEISAGNAGTEVVSHHDALNSYWNLLSETFQKHQNGTLTGIPTGYPLLNKIIGGWRPAKLTILAARPGEGKTAAMLCFAYHAIKHGCNVLIFSIEMDRNQLMQRLVALEAGIDSNLLRDAKMNHIVYGETVWERTEQAIARLQSYPGKIWIDDTPANNIEVIRSRSRRFYQENDVTMIMVDYLQLAGVGVSDSHKTENRRLEVEEISRNLKRIARELDIPVLALAQMSRAVEGRADKVPQLSDLKEASGIEQDADTVMFLYKDPNTPKDALSYPTSLIIEKQRDGEKGAVPLYYVGPETRFHPAERTEKESAE